jgi:hypothetical protein
MYIMPANLQTALKLKAKYPSIWNSNNKEMTILLGFNSELDMIAHGFVSSEDYLTFLKNNWCSGELTPGNIQDYRIYKQNMNSSKEAMALRYIQTLFIQLHGLNSPSCNKELVALNRAFADPTPIMRQKAVHQFDKYMVSFINELDHYKLTGEFLSVEEMNGGKAEEAKAEEPEEEEAEPEVVETIAEETNDCAFYCIFFVGFVIVCHLIYYGKYQLLLVDKAMLCV